MYRSGRWDRSHPGRNVLVVQIAQILLRYTFMKIVSTQIPLRLNMCMPSRSTRSHLGHKWKRYGTYMPLQANCLECGGNRSLRPCRQILHITHTWPSDRPTRHKSAIKMTTQISPPKKGDTSTVYKSFRSYRSFKSCRPTHGKLFVS